MVHVHFSCRGYKKENMMRCSHNTYIKEIHGLCVKNSRWLEFSVGEIMLISPSIGNAVLLLYAKQSQLRSCSQCRALDRSKIVSYGSCRLHIRQKTHGVKDDSLSY